MADRKPTNPDFGREVRIEQKGREVHLIFVASSQVKADGLVTNILNQLKSGALNLAMVGKPTGITDSADG